MNDLRSTPLATQMLTASPAGLAEAARLLRAGGLVAFPTETVYGLGGDATDPAAVARIFAAKGRPHFNPLIAHVAGTIEAEAQGVFDDAARALAAAFWPGPLTLVVPAGPGCSVCDLARAGLGSVALRVPGSPLARDLLAATRRPVAGPSANRSGHVSPSTAAHVQADLAGRIDAVLDGGPAAVGVESTVVACLGGAPRLLRPGAVTRAMIRDVLGQAIAEADAEDAARPVGPGLLASHYAPQARVRLDAAEILPGEAALLFGREALPGCGAARAVLNLSPAGDTIEAAANLFAALRELDATGAAFIAVAPIPADGLGEAIRDRLARAAAPR